MKLYSSIVKALKEGIRDWKVLSMVLLFSPFFILLMKLFYGGDPITYNIGIINLDTGKQSIELLQSMEAEQSSNNESLFELTYFSDQKELEEKVKDKSIDIGIVIPNNYSNILSDTANGVIDTPTKVNIYGSLGNTKYTLAAILANDMIYKQGIEIAKIVLPSEIKETFLEKKVPVNEFENFVPGLISLSVLMLLFTATASIVKENDKNTLVRLKMSRLGAVNYLAGISIVQSVVAVFSMIIAYLTALLLGYHSAGSFLALLVVGIISSLSMVAMSLIIASFLNTVFDVLTIGCFPFFIFMFFSGAMFPLPETNVIKIAGNSFGITDILSLTHTANAFNKILNYGVGLSGVSFELIMILGLTLIYFTLGVFLYQKRKLSKA